MQLRPSVLDLGDRFENRGATSWGYDAAFRKWSLTLPCRACLPEPFESLSCTNCYFASMHVRALHAIDPTPILGYPFLEFARIGRHMLRSESYCRMRYFPACTSTRMRSYSIQCCLGRLQCLSSHYIYIYARMHACMHDLNVQMHV